MRALLLKDFWLHARRLLLYSFGLGALLLLMRLAKPPRPGQEALWMQTYAIFVGLTAIFIFVEWLVARESARRTVLWLRTLPLSDRTLVGSRFVSFAIMFWIVAVIGAFGAWIPAMANNAAELIAVFLAIQAFGGLILGGRMLFGGKGVILVPLGIVLAVILLAQAGLIPSSLATFANKPLYLGLVSIVLYVVEFLVTYQVMSRRESPRWAPL